MLLTIMVGGAAFVAGLVLGDLNKPSVDRAIATLKTAEASAVATLRSITQHKAAGVTGAAVMDAGATAAAAPAPVPADTPAA